MRLGDGQERLLELSGSSRSDESQFERQRRGDFFNHFEHLGVIRGIGIPHDVHPRKVGTASLSSCSRFTLTSLVMSENPVTFPPGCERLSTKPNPPDPIYAPSRLGWSN